MKKQNKPTTSNFWFGFSFGVLSMASAAYLLGTKKGREKLKKLMEYAEQYNEKSGDIFDFVSELTGPKKIEPTDIKGNLESIIDKVKNITLDKKA